MAVGALVLRIGAQSSHHSTAAIVSPIQFGTSSFLTYMYSTYAHIVPIPIGRLVGGGRKGGGKGEGRRKKVRMGSCPKREKGKEGPTVVGIHVIIEDTFDE